mgnify:FL=1
MGTFYRGYILAKLGTAVGTYLRENPIGCAMIRASYSLNGTDLPEDIIPLSFITKDKVPLVSHGAAPYMPDLAAEVQDEDQSDKYMADKAAYYLANGSSMVWLVYPKNQLVEVLTPGARFLLSAEDTLEGGDVLPGFSLAVRDLFAQ